MKRIAFRISPFFAAYLLAACAMVFSEEPKGGVTEEQARISCSSTTTDSLASQTDRRWYAEVCSTLSPE